MRLSNNHIDYIAFLVLKALKEHKNVELLNPDAAVKAVRLRLQENLRIEEEIEREAEALLAPHKQQILQSGSDYRKMLQEGKRTLAKRKGFVL